MKAWSAGYVAEIEYTYGYYAELNPERIKLAFTANGLVFPRIGTACELGFGQGLSNNIHAAASNVSWWGTDFNSSQAGFAQELSAVSGAKLYDCSFADFCSRSDLPNFDYIALHGIWSWISDENRRVIADFVRRKLKVGGVLYISYNALPGWSTAAPLRHLMTQHKTKMSANGVGIAKQIDEALEFTGRLLAGNPLWGSANPQIAEHFKTVKPQNRHYLAHEYFNKDWHPMYFADMAEHLEAAKLNFAASAHYSDFVDAINLTAENQARLNEIPDPNFRQSIRDYMVNQQFRKDYWVKGPRRLNAVERSEALRSQGVVLIAPRTDVKLKAKGALGEAKMAENVYNPILDLLADHQVRTLGQIEQSLQGQGVLLPQIEQAILILIGEGYVAPVQAASVIAASIEKAQALNRVLFDKARGSKDINYLASPVTGGGLAIGRFHQLFLLAKSQGHKTPEDWAKFTWVILAGQGQRIIKEGRTLETPEENLRELIEKATTFNTKWMPIMKGLQII